jgi:hypothetical protein
MRGLSPPLLTIFLATSALAAMNLGAAAQVSVDLVIRSNAPPPPLPVYAQPPIPAPNSIWNPGYWAWSGDDYYWVPGVWVAAPSPGLLWTPGYWAFSDGAYVYNSGYWGPRVGYYGGIDYGFGYTGQGYEGGRWRDGRFYYNQSVNNVEDGRAVDVYNKTVVVNRTAENHVSFNGGPDGVAARPTPYQLAVARERHIPPTASQMTHVSAARADPALLATHNHGAPPVAAIARPGPMNGANLAPTTPASGKPLPAIAPSAATNPGGDRAARVEAAHQRDEAYAGRLRAAQQRAGEREERLKAAAQRNSDRDARQQAEAQRQAAYQQRLQAAQLRATERAQRHCPPGDTSGCK